MADGVTLDPGAGGDKIATDDLGPTGHVQWVKLRDGTDGGTEVIAGDTANGLDVDVTRVQGSVAVTGPLTDAELRATPVSVEQATSVDVADGGGSLTVDNATISVVGGGVEAAAQRVTLASDSTGVLSVDDNGGNLSIDDGGNSITVDSTQLPGALAANGGIKVEGVVGGVAQPVSGSVTADTELPDAAALSDSTANPTAPMVGSGGMLWNGTNWRRVKQAGATIASITSTGLPAVAMHLAHATDDYRQVIGAAVLADGSAGNNLLANHGYWYNGSTYDHARGDAANGLDVDVTRLPSGTVAGGSSLPAGTNNIGDVDVLTLPALPAGTNNIGDVDVLTIAAGTNTIGAVNVKPTTTGGLSIGRDLSFDETETEIKATAGQVFGWYFFNNAATVRYVKFYNATAANVTVGVTTPVMTVPIPPGSAANVEYTNGIAFGTAICVACTTGVADADATAPTANDLVGNVFYT